MAESRIAAIPLQRDGSANNRIGGDELAHGLMLVRESAMNVARLQLALEGRDRKQVLERMDELVALDRRIDAFVAEIPTSDDSIPIMQDQLQELRRTLSRDRLVLAAGVGGKLRGEGSGGSIVGRWGEAGDSGSNQASVLELGLADQVPWDDRVSPEADQHERRDTGHEPRAAAFLAKSGLMLLALAFVVACVVLLSPDAREWLGAVAAGWGL
jgi:hypothetical protein